jgi:hypothetical protein
MRKRFGKFSTTSTAINSERGLGRDFERALCFGIRAADQGEFSPGGRLPYLSGQLWHLP